jgi:quercetin dioxygenase-like cupin family protein
LLRINIHKVLTGPGPDGRSTILADEPIAEPPPGQSRAATEIWMTPALPPELPYVRPKTTEAAELGVGIPPGAARSIYSLLAPGHQVPMHRTDTYDLAFVIRCSVELLLQDGSSTQLHAGDAVVMPATVHGIRVGPDGAVLTGIAIGIGRP